MIDFDMPCRFVSICGGIVTLRRCGTGSQREGLSFPNDRIVNQTCGCDLSAIEEIKWLAENRASRPRWHAPVDDAAEGSAGGQCIRGMPRGAQEQHSSRRSV